MYAATLPPQYSGYPQSGYMSSATQGAAPPPSYPSYPQQSAGFNPFASMANAPGSQGGQSNPSSAAGWSPGGGMPPAGPMPAAARAPNQVGVHEVRKQVRVKLPDRPVDLHKAILEQMEVCATPWPDSSMTPAPQGPMKMWYNSYVYVPENRSHLERQYLDRFIPGPNGDWLDSVKAKQMTEFFEEKQFEDIRKDEEKAMINAAVSGSSLFGFGSEPEDSMLQATQYTDAYTGKPLHWFRGRLVYKEELEEEQ